MNNNIFIEEETLPKDLFIIESFPKLLMIFIYESTNDPQLEYESATDSNDVDHGIPSPTSLAVLRRPSLHSEPCLWQGGGRNNLHVRL